METGLKFIFSADHNDSRWAFDNEPIRVSIDSHGGVTCYYANHVGFGCGRNYPNPRAAILGLISSAGCSNIRIAEADAQAVEAQAQAVEATAQAVKATAQAPAIANSIEAPAQAQYRSELSAIEILAISAIASIGMEVIAAKTPAEISLDNMTWFDFPELAARLHIFESEATEIMATLESAGYITDSGENPNRDRGPEPNLWTLNETGIAIAETEAQAVEAQARAQADEAQADEAQAQAVEAQDIDSSGSISVSGLCDNRREDTKNNGGIVSPVISVSMTGYVERVGDDHDSAGIGITAETARRLAGDLIRAADAIDNGADYFGRTYAARDDSAV